MIRLCASPYRASRHRHQSPPSYFIPRNSQVSIGGGSFILTMEVAGLTFSVVSLLDTCLTASRLYSSAKNFSRDSESLIVGLLWQQSRLRLWGKAWRIPIDSGGGAQATGAPPPQAVAPGALLEQEVRERNLDPTVVYRTLQSMQSLLSEGEKLAGRHQEDADVEKVTSSSAV